MQSNFLKNQPFASLLDARLVVSVRILEFIGSGKPAL